MKGAGGTPGGLGSFLAGLAIRPTSLFDTLLMLILLAGGLGLVARSLRAQGAGAAGSNSAAE